MIGDTITVRGELRLNMNAPKPRLFDAAQDERMTATAISKIKY